MCLIFPSSSKRASKTKRSHPPYSDLDLPARPAFCAACGLYTTHCTHGAEAMFFTGRAMATRNAAAGKSQMYSDTAEVLRDLQKQLHGTVEGKIDNVAAAMKNSLKSEISSSADAIRREMEVDRQLAADDRQKRDDAEIQRERLREMDRVRKQAWDEGRERINAEHHKAEEERKERERDQTMTALKDALDLLAEMRRTDEQQQQQQQQQRASRQASQQNGVAVENSFHEPPSMGNHFWMQPPPPVVVVQRQPAPARPPRRSRPQSWNSGPTDLGGNQGTLGGGRAQQDQHGRQRPRSMHGNRGQHRR